MPKSIEVADGIRYSTPFCCHLQHEGLVEMLSVLFHAPGLASLKLGITLNHLASLRQVILRNDTECSLHTDLNCHV